jgi:hypothetical protein
MTGIMKPNGSKGKKEPIPGGGGLKFFGVCVLTSPDVGVSIFFVISMSALCGVNMSALFWVTVSALLERVTF